MFGIDDAILVGAGTQIFGGMMTNRANKDMADNQMAFQKYMSDTSYQRSVKDMMAAGLNPMLAYSKGGASTPSGGTAVMEDVLGKSVNTAMSAAMIRANLRKINAEADAAESASANNYSLAAFHTAQLPQIEAQTALHNAQTEQSATQSYSNMAMRDLLLQQVKHEAYKQGLTEAEISRVKAEVLNAFATGREIDARTGNIKIDSVLKQLDIPRATNEANAQDTWWKRNLAPYLSDINKVVNTGASLVGAYRAANPKIILQRGK